MYRVAIMPTLRYYRIPDDDAAAADNSNSAPSRQEGNSDSHQHEAVPVPVPVPAPAQREREREQEAALSSAAAAAAAAIGGPTSSQQPLPAQVPSANIPPQQLLQCSEKAAAAAPDHVLHVVGATATVCAAPGPAAPPTAGEEAAAEAAAAYSAAASSVASLWDNGSASSAAASAAWGGRGVGATTHTSTCTAAGSMTTNDPHRRNLPTAAAAAASTTWRTTAAPAPAASQLLGMMTPAQQQTSAPAAMELERLERRLLLLRRSLAVGPAAAAAGGMGGMGGMGRMGGAGGMSGRMGGMGRHGGPLGLGSGGSSGSLGGGGHLGSGGPFITSTATAQAAAAGGFGFGMSSMPSAHRSMMMARNNNPQHAPMSLFAGRQPPLHQSTAAAQSTLPPTGNTCRSTPAPTCTYPAPLPARKPTPPSWVANFELTPEVAARAEASASSDLHLPTPQDGSSHDRAVYASMNHPFASSIGASQVNPVAIRQALMREMVRNNNHATACNPNTAGAVGLQHRYMYKGTGGGIHGGDDAKCSTSSSGAVDSSAGFPTQPQQKSMLVSPVDANTDETESSPVPLANTNAGSATTSTFTCTPENDDGDDSTTGESESVVQSPSPAPKLHVRPKLKKRPISRPKNGYNYFFSFGSKKMKRRDEIMGIIRRRLKTYKKDTGNDANHLFSSSLWYLDQINKTNLFAEQWGSNGIVRSGLRYRFQVEAVSDQENYRSVIKTWEAAEKFNSLDLDLPDGPDTGGG